MKKVAIACLMILFSLPMISCSKKASGTNNNTGKENREMKIYFSISTEKPVEKAKLVESWAHNSSNTDKNNNGNNNSTSHTAGDTDAKYDKTKGKYYVPQFNKYVNSLDELFAISNSIQARAYNYIITSTGEERLFNPAATRASGYDGKFDPNPFKPPE
jgi:hypothetical protein